MKINTIIRAATQKQRGDHDFYVSLSHYTDTDQTWTARRKTQKEGKMITYGLQSHLYCHHSCPFHHSRRHHHLSKQDEETSTKFAREIDSTTMKEYRMQKKKKKKTPIYPWPISHYKTNCRAASQKNCFYWNSSLKIFLLNFFGNQIRLCGTQCTSSETTIQQGYSNWNKMLLT